MSRLDDLRMIRELVGRSSFSLSTSHGVVELRRGRSLGPTAARALIGDDPQPIARLEEPSDHGEDPAAS